MMTNVTEALAESDDASVAVKVKADDPPVPVGVPVIAPVDEFSDNPAGNVPLVRLQVTGPLVVVAANVVL